MIRLRLACAATTAAVVQLVIGLAAQAPTGAVAGSVKDPSGGVLPGVTVTLSGPPLDRPRTAVSSASGGFRFTELPDGSFTLIAQLAGFKKATRTVSVSSGRQVDLPPIVLDLGAASEPDLGRMGLTADDIPIEFVTSLGTFDLAIQRRAGPAAVDLLLKHLDAHFYDGGRIAPVIAGDRLGGKTLQALELIERADVPDASAELRIAASEEVFAGSAHQVVGRVWHWPGHADLVAGMFHQGPESLGSSADITRARRVVLMDPAFLKSQGHFTSLCGQAGRYAEVRRTEWQGPTAPTSWSFFARTTTATKQNWQCPRLRLIQCWP